MIALIAAVASNGVIGKDGKIPWRLSEDLRRFKELTMGHTLIMGRKTFESIGRALPGRRAIVLSGETPALASVAFRADKDLILAASLDAAIGRAIGEIFICGGQQVYREALERDLVDKVYLTRIDAEYRGDAYFPVNPATYFDSPKSRHPGGFRCISQELHEPSSRISSSEFPHRYSFYDYERIR